MTVVASCGCTVASTDDVVAIRYSTEECYALEGFVPAVVSASYCKSCAEKASSWPEYITDDEAEEAFWRSVERNWD